MVLAECSSLTSTLIYAHVLSHVSSQDQNRCSAESYDQNVSRNNIVSPFDALYKIGCEDSCFTGGAFRIAWKITAASDCRKFCFSSNQIYRWTLSKVRCLIDTMRLLGALECITAVLSIILTEAARRAIPQDAGGPTLPQQMTALRFNSSRDSIKKAQELGAR